MKKKWEKPSMRVIVRNKPEEAVLAGCKYVVYGSGPDNTNTNCRHNGCPECQQNFTS